MSNLTPIVGTAHIVQAKSIASPIGPPHTYLGMSRALLTGVEPLAASGVTASVPLAFISAQVAECSLKAFLSRSGDDTRLKTRVLRHNLEALWRLAHSEGLAVPADPPSWLLNLSQLHGAPYFIRYSTGVNGLVTPAAA